MSINSISLTPSVEQARDVSSKIIYAKEIADYAGTDLSSADTYTQMAFPINVELPRNWQERTGKLWNGVTFHKGVDKEAMLSITFANRLKAVLQDYAEAMEGRIYSFLIEFTETALDGNYQLLHCMGTLISVPQIDKAAEPQFGFRVHHAEAAISLDVEALYTGGTLSKLNQAFVSAAGDTITQAKDQPFGFLETAFLT